MDMIETLLAEIGRRAIRVNATLGEQFLFYLDGVRHIFLGGKLPGKIFRQIHVIGCQSLSLILLIGLFTGMVLGLQGYYLLIKFGSAGLLGTAVALSLIRELGPVLTAIMIAGRAGSAMAAEIGVMRITDQIDALEVMDIPSMGHLVSPRLVAALLAFPLLTAIYDVVGIIGGYLTGVIMLGISDGIYFYRVETSVIMHDVLEGFLKAVVFSQLVTMVCCHQGYNAHRRRDSMGPEAVGNATTSAVVISSILILIADYVLTSFMMQ
jgi:phospholipid/cholesterol/gamma-HCH transport system permease protein